MILWTLVLILIPITVLMIKITILSSSLFIRFISQQSKAYTYTDKLHITWNNISKNIEKFKLDSSNWWSWINILLEKITKNTSLHDKTLKAIIISYMKANDVIGQFKRPVHEEYPCTKFVNMSLHPKHVDVEICFK